MTPRRPALSLLLATLLIPAIPAAATANSHDKQLAASPAHSATHAATHATARAGTHQGVGKAGGKSAAKAARPRKKSKPGPVRSVEENRHYEANPEVRTFVDDLVRRQEFDRDALLALFAQARFQPAVIKAILPPSSPRQRSWQAYRARFLDPLRIRAGLRFWDDHAATLQRAEAQYGVPAEIVVAIIGVETVYGRNTGDFETFSALTTLAFDYPPRAELFRRELEALLLLSRDEGRSPLSYRGSYAGALGLPQFLPSSLRKFAVDYDGDGHEDLTDPDDAIGSVAHFLAEHGWEKGGPIAVPAQVTEGPAIDALIAEGITPRRLPEELRGFGVLSAPGDRTPQRPTALIDLATPDEATEYRLGYQNFFVITRYNRSSFYAGAVSDLADALREARGQR